MSTTDGPRSTPRIERAVEPSAHDAERDEPEQGVEVDAESAPEEAGYGYGV